MELKTYLNVVWKRIWIPLVLVTVVIAVSLWMQTEPPPQYVATMRFIVSVKPEREAQGFSYDGYYAAIASEYTVDDFSGVISSEAFTQDINRYLESMDSPIRLTAGTVRNTVTSDKLHRILTITIVWPNPNELAVIGEAIAAAVENEGPRYLEILSAFGGVVQLIDPPSSPSQVPPPLTDQLDIPIRIGLALAMSGVLIFLLEYFDNRIRERSDLESLGIPVLAEVTRRR